MPVAQGPKFDLRSATVIGGIALVVAFGLGIAALFFAQSSGNIEVRLGDAAFQRIETDRMAESIADQGPVLWPDVAGGSRDIWLQHVGDDNGSGWTAFDARPTGASRDCNALWDPDARTFTDPCTESVYPETGEGLPQIPVFFDGRELIIDINGVHNADQFQGYLSDEDFARLEAEAEAEAEAG